MERTARVTREQAIEQEYVKVCNAIGQNAVHREELLMRAQQLRADAYDLQQAKGNPQKETSNEVQHESNSPQMRSGSDVQPEAISPGASPHGDLGGHA